MHHIVNAKKIAKIWPRRNQRMAAEANKQHDGRNIMAAAARNIGIGVMAKRNHHEIGRYQLEETAGGILIVRGGSAACAISNGAASIFGMWRTA